MNERSVRLGAALTAFVILLVPAGATQAESSARATAGPPMDYLKIPGLSKPVYTKTIHESFMLRMSDGIGVYVEVTRPRAKGRFPVIAEISPYHGTHYNRDGWRMLPDQGGLVKYFVPRGYAVVMMDERGTGRSQGCLDHMGRKDQGDAKQLIEWAAAQPWSSGRVGALGHSYPGGTAVMSLAERPRGLATIVVSAGIGSMYEHQFQGGVPYNFQWAGPAGLGYYPLSLERHLPVGLRGVGSGRGGDNFGNDMQYFGCGATTISLFAGESQLSGQYSGWHAERDFVSDAARGAVPVFVIQGVNDQAARVNSTQWFLRRNGRVKAEGKPVVDKLWLGQWDHGVGCCPNRRGYQWTLALNAWFDRHLQGRKVDTGPPVEIFLADGWQQDVQQGARTEIFTAERFPARPRMITLYTDADGALSGRRLARSGSLSFAGDPYGYFSPDLTEGVAFRTNLQRRDVLLAGVPKLDLAASVSVPRVYLIATLYDEDAEGNRRRLTQFAINPELRNGIATVTPVTPGERYVLDPPGWPMAHRLKRGHRLVLRVTTSDPDKVPFFAVDPKITIFTGPHNTVLRLPVIDDPVLYPDDLRLRPPKAK